MVLFIQAAVTADLQASNEHRQRQTLQHQRDGDDHEGEKHDQVALRERFAGRRHGHGQRQRRRQRHDAAHAAPAHYEQFRLGRRGIVGAIARACQARQPGRRIDPGEAHQDGNRADQHAGHDQLHRGLAGQPSGDLGQLQADEHEHQTVEEEHQQVPHRTRDDACLGRDDLRRVTPAHQPRSHHRKHARHMHRLRQDIGHVRHRQSRQHFDKNIAKAAVNRHEQHRHRDTDGDAAGRHSDKLHTGVDQRKRARHHCRHRELVDHQARGVVDQTLAFENGHHAARYVQARQNGGGRHRVRRRDDGPEHECRRPRHIRHQHLERGPDRKRGDDYQANGQQADRADIDLEIAPRRQQRRLIQDGRQHQRQDKLRVQWQFRQIRHEPQRAATDDQRDRIGKAKVARDPAQRHGAQQQEQYNLEQRHAEFSPRLVIEILVAMPADCSDQCRQMSGRSAFHR